MLSDIYYIFFLSIKHQLLIQEFKQLSIFVFTLFFKFLNEIACDISIGLHKSTTNLLDDFPPIKEAYLHLLMIS